MLKFRTQHFPHSPGAVASTEGTAFLKTLCLEHRIISCFYTIRIKLRRGWWGRNVAGAAGVYAAAPLTHTDVNDSLRLSAVSPPGPRDASCPHIGWMHTPQMNHSREGVHKWLKYLLWRWKRGFRKRKWRRGRASVFSQELCHWCGKGDKTSARPHNQKTHFKWLILLRRVCACVRVVGRVLFFFKQESGCPSGRCAEWLELSVSCCQKCLSQLKHVAAEEKSGVSDLQGV